MRLIVIFKSMIAVLFALVSPDAFAKVQQEIQVPSFSPGNYLLVRASGHDNAAELCSDGDFRLSESGQQILFGPKHGFSLKNRVTTTVATDDPAEKGCIYENSNTFSPGEDNTLVALKEVLKCDGEVRHMFTETAIITKGRVHLEFKQTNSTSSSRGEKNISYKCTWELKDRSAASIKKKKK